MFRGYGSGGVLKLSDTSGVGSTTLFTAMLEGWMADNDMLFAVQYSNTNTAGSNGAVAVGLPSVYPKLSFTLPGPATTTPATVYVRGMVVDTVTGGTAYTPWQAVTVSTARTVGESIVTAASRLLSDNVKPALQQGNYESK